ncbi:hypothetical protein AB0B79_37425 [Streptomyces sp. NPDC039022]|uniref:hypothetical protein n=1 Tax=unclassified Streptomyces TaxID=2593676 RepID=UPI0033CCF193
MIRNQWDRWREVVVAALIFVVVLAISWEICAGFGHPHDGANRWAVCVGLAVVMATAAGLVLHKEAARQGRESAGGVVEGDDNRVAGAGAHRNAFGDRASVGGVPPATARPASDERDAEDAGIEVRGNRNRVAGSGAHDNAFGDDSEVRHP